LSSTDTVMAITGGAGTGKSSLMEEAAEAIRANGKEVFVFAPSTGAREVLEEKGFKEAQTVEHLLRNEKLQANLQNQVIWVDESGLLDVRSMNSIFKIAKEQNARVVLSGDTRQHSGVGRGEAMRLLEARAGLHVTRIDKIQRQKGQYKRAVALISQGHAIVDQKAGTTGRLVAGFDLLDRLGKIKEIAAEDRYTVLAEQYLKHSDPKNTPLVIAPTHAEGEKVTESIRNGLREAGAIGEKTRDFTKLRSLNLSEAEKSEAGTYDQENLLVQFHQNVVGFKRGERYRVQREADGKVSLQSLDGRSKKAIPYDAASRFEVYQETTTSFAVGDKIRFSLGGKATDGKRRISNGRLDEIKGFDRSGNIRLKSGMTVFRDYGHWDLGYCITSHAAQGKDRKVSLAAIGSQSLPAVNAKQFYVTVSRGREDVAIYVDDKELVRKSIQSSGEQLSATELVHGKEQQQVAISQRVDRRRIMDRVRQWWQKYVPHREVTQVRKQKLATNFNPSPELSRS